MIFDVEVHDDSVIHSLVRHFLVLANDGIEAGKKAMKVAEKENSESSGLYVKCVRELDGEFIQ